MAAIRKPFLLVLLGSLAATGLSEAEVTRWRFGGEGVGQGWSDWSAYSLVMDYEASPVAMQPFELDPEENLLPRLTFWERWEEPRMRVWRSGMPRIWLGWGAYYQGSDWDPRLLLDGDPTTGNVFRIFDNASYGVYTSSREFYTLDLGVRLPVERFRFYSRDGEEGLVALRNFEVTGGNNAERAASGQEIVAVNTSSLYAPLENLLARVENNFELEADVQFPRQYLRFIRHMPLTEDLEDVVYFSGTVTGFNQQTERTKIASYGLAELELYGRGFAPEATWVSIPVDAGETVNVGGVSFGASRWRRQGDQLVEAPEAPSSAKIDLRTGIDDNPATYYTYNDLGKQVQTTADDYYNNLRPGTQSVHAINMGRGTLKLEEGFRGPIGEDRDNWSFWSAPLDRSGDRPRLPPGRYFQLRVRLKTDSLWEFARLDSLVVETAPLLAERVAGEVAVASELQPPGNVAQVSPGELTEFVYEMGAVFSATGQSGFDAVRLFAPAPIEFLSLEMGDPLAPVEPDSLWADDGGTALYLPRRIGSDGDERLRIRLQTTLFDAAGELNAEVFARTGESLPQAVEPGDVTAELGTNQLRVLVGVGTIGKALGEVDVLPGILTPQGDGVNDIATVAYSLFKVRSARVDVGVYGLDGSRVRQLFSGNQSAGRRAQTWDGRDDGGNVVAPGLYLLRVKVDSDAGGVARLHPVAVVY